MSGDVLLSEGDKRVFSSFVLLECSESPSSTVWAKVVGMSVAVVDRDDETREHRLSALLAEGWEAGARLAEVAIWEIGWELACERVQWIVCCDGCFTPGQTMLDIRTNPALLPLGIAAGYEAEGEGIDQLVGNKNAMFDRIFGEFCQAGNLLDLRKVLMEGLALLFLHACEGLNKGVADAGVNGRCLCLKAIQNICSELACVRSHFDDVNGSRLIISDIVEYSVGEEHAKTSANADGGKKITLAADTFIAAGVVTKLRVIETCFHEAVKTDGLMLM